MKLPRSAFSSTIEALLESGAKSAVKFLSEDTVVKATLPHKIRRNGRGHSMIVTFGKPNYAEREFIKACKRAGEPLPVRKIQLKFWPEAR